MAGRTVTMSCQLRLLVVFAVTTFNNVSAMPSFHFSEIIVTTGVMNDSSVVVVEQQHPISAYECFQTCNSKSNCDFINYHLLAHLCQHIRVDGLVTPTVANAAGFLYGSKIEWQTEGFTSCGTCSANELCNVSDGNTCNKTGCGAPPYVPSSQLIGNIFTVNSHVVYSQPASGVTMTYGCYLNGTWIMDSMKVPPVTTTTTSTTTTTTTSTTAPTTTASGAFVTTGWIQRPPSGNLYMVVSTPTDWHTALDYCDQYGYLTVIYHSSEEEFINGLVEGVNLTSYWAGATDDATEGTWKWVLSTLAWGYDNFEAGEPYGSSTDCLLITPGNQYTWSDHVCSQHHGFVCEQIDL